LENSLERGRRALERHAFPHRGATAPAARLFCFFLFLNFFHLFYFFCPFVSFSALSPKYLFSRRAGAFGAL
jgi:hypothetical protein